MNTESQEEKQGCIHVWSFSTEIWWWEIDISRLSKGIEMMLMCFTLKDSSSSYTICSTLFECCLKHFTTCQKHYWATIFSYNMLPSLQNLLPLVCKWNFKETELKQKWSDLPRAKSWMCSSRFTHEDNCSRNDLTECTTSSSLLLTTGPYEVISDLASYSLTSSNFL